MATPRPAPNHYPESAPGGWTVEKIRSAITSLEQGYLGPASRLTRALSRHPRYVQGRDQLIGAVQGCPAEIIQSPISYGGVGLSRRLAEGAGGMLAGVLAGGAERWLIEWSKVMPLAVGVLSWDTTARPWRPVSLTRWPLEAVRVDLYRRELWAMVEGGREERITPGDGTWVVAWNSSPFDMATGLIRCLGEAWIRGINAGRDIANRSQATATVALISPTPTGEDMESDRVISVGTKLQDLQKGGPAGIQLPPGWEAPTGLDLASKDGSSTLQLAREDSNTDLLVPWLMQDGTAKNEGGSLAKAQVLDGVLYSAVAALTAQLWGEVTADGSHVPGVITDQIVRPWALYQVGDGEPRGEVVPLAIRRVPDLEEDARLKANADRSAVYWREVVQIESAIRRDMSEDELRELARARGVVVPETVFRERGAPQPPTAPIAA